MKAVICQNKTLSVAERPTPRPGKGQVLLNVLRCGICGSDLHAKDHCDHWGALMIKTGYKQFMRSDEPTILGHEFCGEIADYGQDCSRKLKPGTRVVAMPILRCGNDIDLLGFTGRSGGSFAEQVVVEETLMTPIPNGLSSDMAALTEPMAVAYHAVRRGEVKKDDVAIVIGCGPVGLAVICCLKAMGVRTVIAANRSAGRRAMAKACGADIVVDPRADSPYTAGNDNNQYGHLAGLPDAFELGLGTREKLGKLPIPWQHTWRLAETLGFAEPKRPIIFECVGAPDMLQRVIDDAPLFSRVVVVGVCMATDRIEPSMAINKEIDLRFAFGYTPLEFHDTLHMIAEGKLNCSPLVTGVVGLEGVDNAFAALSKPDEHVKILIDPSSKATQPTKPASA